MPTPGLSGRSSEIPDVTDNRVQPAGPLSGLRIIDLTNVLFGPLATQTLGDWGADVIKVEGTDGDLWRYTGQFRHRGMGGQFMAVNRNKRSIAVNLKSVAGKEILARLITSADALVSNIRPAGLARLGFDYDRCRALNEKIVYVSATGFGQDGPWAARPAFDEIIQASSGFSAAIGTDDEPIFVPSLVADKICGMALAGAITAALLHRERTGEGQQVEVPMLETLAAFNSIEMLGGHAFEPAIGPTRYNRVRERQPVRTSDGWMTILPYTGEQWRAFFEASGFPEYIEHYAVLDPVQRARNVDQLYAEMRRIAPGRTTGQWQALLLELDIPHAEFTKLDQVTDQEHLKAVGLFQQMEHPTEGAIVQARPATRFSASPAGVHRPTPRLGEHTRELLVEVGFQNGQIDHWLDEAVVLQADESNQR